MNSIQIFENSEFGQIRTVEIDGEPWFVGKDVAVALGYQNPQRAIRNYVDDEDKGVTEMVTPGGKQQIPIINESGVYSLILSSKLPNAKKFKHWITAEVLPSIRKHGGYIAGQEEMSSEELLSRALLFAKSKMDNLGLQNQELTARIEADAPAVAFANDVASSKGAITLDQFAKALYDKCGIEIGQNRLFKFLRDIGILKQNNTPKQKYMERGWFNVREVWKNGNVFTQTLICGTGQQKLYEIIKDNYQMA